MIIEIILGSIIMALISVLVYERYENKKERLKMLNALMSRTPEQFRDLELTDKVKPIETPKRSAPEFIAESELTDEQFRKVMKNNIA